MKRKSSDLLLVVTGPTAVGKTGAAISLARHFQTGIISADARQFYREIRIGTAMPSPEELAAAQHHFIGHLSVLDYYNVSMFEQQALALLQKLFKRNSVVVLTGGSGLYIDTLCHGIDSLPPVDQEVRLKVRQLYSEEGLAGLRNMLKSVDPLYFERVDPANPNRIMRGIEVYLQTGVPYSVHLSGKPPERPFRIKKIVLQRDRQELVSMINARTEQMIRQGLVEEALACYRFRHVNALNTVGYREIYQWLANMWTLPVAIEKIKTNTRRYAKRQITWFKKYENARWFHPSELEAMIRFAED